MNNFGFEILHHLNKKINSKTVAEEKNDLFFNLSLCCFVFCPKSLKLPSGLTKLCNYVNNDYDYDRLAN